MRANHHSTRKLAMAPSLTQPTQEPGLPLIPPLPTSEGEEGQMRLDLAKVMEWSA